MGQAQLVATTACAAHAACKKVVIRMHWWSGWCYALEHEPTQFVSVTKIESVEPRLTQRLVWVKVWVKDGEVDLARLLLGF